MRSRAALRGQLLPPPVPTICSIVLVSILVTPDGPHGPELNRSVVTNGLKAVEPPFAAQSGSFGAFQSLIPKPPCQKPGVQPAPHGLPVTLADAVALAVVLSGS